MIYTTDIFIKKAREVHGNKYDYSKVEYINSQSKVCIICPKHGEFWQTPDGHLRGQGCPQCSIEINSSKRKSNIQEFINKAREVHGNKYDYSKVEYINTYTKVCIICPKHGEFWQRPNDHLYGTSCPKCFGNQLITTEEFIKKAREVHGNKYDYSKVEYTNNHTKVCIICPKHGEFWQTPNSHLYGQGCSKCIQSNLEKEVENALKNNNVDFIAYYKPFFLKTHKGHSQHLDYFIPSKNIAIECQGIQHYVSIEYFGGETAFKKMKKYDQRKRELCQKNNIRLLYYTSEKHQEYDGFDSQNTFTNITKLLDMILS